MPLHGGENFAAKGNTGNIFYDSEPTRDDTVKWIVPVDSPCQIGLVIAWKEVLIVV